MFRPSIRLFFLASAAAAWLALAACTTGSAKNQERTSVPAAPASSATAPASTTVPAMSATVPVEVEAGTALRTRLNQPLSSATAYVGQSFQGSIATPVLVNGEVAIPQGAAVTGTVTAADAAGHFQGQSRLALALTGLQYGKESYGLSTRTIIRLASSRSSRSEETIGGGAAVGALLGALMGHGKGAAIGAASGAGAGTADQALTQPAEVELPAETTLSFRLAAPVQVIPEQP